jgi:hypothetical protein
VWVGHVSLSCLRVTVVGLPTASAPELVLRLVNPADVAGTVEVRAAAWAAGGPEALAPLPRVALGGYNELLDFDEGDSAASIVSDAEADTGVLSKRGNEATVRLRFAGPLPASIRAPALALTIATQPTDSSSPTWKPLHVLVAW